MSLSQVACLTALASVPREQHLQVLYELSKTAPQQVLEAIAAVKS